jgi:hypothetical protein
MDAHPKIDTAFRRQSGIPLDHSALYLDGAADGINDASELDEDAIARPLNDPAVMQSDGGVNQIAADGTQPRKRPLLIGTGQLAVPDYVRREDRCELPGFGHERPLTGGQTSTDLTPIWCEPAPDG